METNCCCVPIQLQPCPRCGYCPCCGRGYGFAPYQPYYPQPIWMGTTGGYVPSTTTGVIGSPIPNVVIC
jgi:hypothetical protein